MKQINSLEKHLGLKLFDRLSADGLKKVVCGFMAVVGCYLVITG